MRLSKNEKALIESGAKAAKLSTAGFLAHAGLAAARDLTRITDVAAAIADNRAILSELFAARRALTQGGNLLNQSAKALNSGGQSPRLDDDIDLMLATRTRVDAAIELFIAAIEGRSPQGQPHPARDQFGEAA
ncbi:mobilization protein [Streptomyces sp. NPDC048416]|uniref:mobilization protein n=1 Tax=Streptomyces sp. NPDC048416 TaxID=3365546 RepID=UPI003722C9FD